MAFSFQKQAAGVPVQATLFLRLGGDISVVATLSHLEGGHKLQIDVSKRANASSRFTADRANGRFDTWPELALIEGVWGSVSGFKLYGTAHRVKEQKRILCGGFYADPKWKDQPKANILSDVSAVGHLVFSAVTKLSYKLKTNSYKWISPPNIYIYIPKLNLYNASQHKAEV